MSCVVFLSCGSRLTSKVEETLEWRVSCTLAQVVRTIVSSNVRTDRRRSFRIIRDPMTRVLQSHAWRFLGARCASSCHGACTMVGLDLVDYGWTGGSDHRVKISLWTRSHKNAFDAITTIHQKCSDMQLDFGRHIVQSLCVECCVKLLEFAHTSACVCLSCFCARDAHDFFAECFNGCRRSMRGRRVAATREFQQYTSSR